MPESKNTAAVFPRALYPLLVLAAGLIAYIPYLGSYGLLDPTDSFFLESGREILETNQFLLPVNNYQPWLDKPILFFWMVAYAYKFFGIHPFIGRLPAALSAVAAGLIIYAGCRPMLNRRYAAVAALIFLCSPLVSIVGHVCLTDMTLCALITGSILFLFKALESRKNSELLIGYFFLSLAMLCKGPVCLIICGISLLPYIVSVSKSRNDFFSMLMRLKPLLGIAILLLLNLPWYIAASLATNGKFLETFFITQNFGRLVGTVNHQGPFYFYVPVFFGGFLPWCIFCFTACGILQKTMDKRNQEPSLYRRFFRLNLLWFLAVMAMFSIIKTKLPTYILPAAPAFAILTAMQLQIFGKTNKYKRLLPSTITLALLLLVGLMIHPLLKGYVRDIVSQSLWIIAPLGCTLGLCIYALNKHKWNLFLSGILSFAFISCSIMVPRGLTVFYQTKQIAFSKLVKIAKEANASISMIFAEEPSIPWITHKPVSRLQNKEEAQQYLKEKSAPHYVLVQTANLDRLEWFESELQEIQKAGKWHLYAIQKPGQKALLPTPEISAK
ncbi:MAG: glycosyltransferase family 39 protein [Candidatus Obscuribacterales bacterium]|nr:glycosyltransferase family 39 protein [Candidatus Obscuribacterales bacterium]